MRKILLVIPISALLISALVWYRETHPPVPGGAPTIASGVRPAPLFQLYDDQSQIVRLARYVGRHKLLLVFFDGSASPDQNPLLAELRTSQNFLPIHQTGAIVLAISTLRPSELRPPVNEKGERTERAEPFPFPMLADINNLEVHQLYGAVDEVTGKPREAVFVIDRGGQIRHAHLGPDDLGTPALWAEELRRVR